MIRTVVLLLINLALALGLAVSVMPVALVVAPALRGAPASGYAVLGVATATFLVINTALWRVWRRQSR